MTSADKRLRVPGNFLPITAGNYASVSGLHPLAISGLASRDIGELSPKLGVRVRVKAGI